MAAIWLYWRPSQIYQPVRVRWWSRKKIELDNPQAKALQYVHVATESTSPLYKDGSICGNCIQWKGGDAEWGQCVLFAGVVVANAGWCSAWVKG